MLNKINALERILLLVLLISAGCAKSPDPQPQQTTVQGRAMAGPINGGTVKVFALNSKGDRAGSLGSTTTDANGNYSLSIIEQTGPIEVVISGGSYKEESTGKIVQVTTPIRARTHKAKAGSPVSLAITPLTEIATQRAISLSKTLPLKEAIRAANKQVGKLAGIKKPASVSSTKGRTSNMNSAQIGHIADSASTDDDFADITSVIPLPPDQPIADKTSAEAQATLFLATLSQLAQTKESQSASTTGTPTSSLDIMTAMAKDFENDGSLDGKDNGTAVTLTVSSAPLPTSGSDWANQLNTATTAFLGSGENVAGFDATSETTVTTQPTLTIPSDPDNPVTVTTLASVSSNNGGDPVYCSCNLPSLSVCIDYTGSLFATACQSMQDSCLAIAADGILANAACAKVDSGAGGSCTPAADDASLTSIQYFYGSDPDLLSEQETSCTDDGGTWANI